MLALCKQARLAGKPIAVNATKDLSLSPFPRTVHPPRSARQRLGGTDHVARPQLRVKNVDFGRLGAPRTGSSLRMGAPGFARRWVLFLDFG